MTDETSIAAAVDAAVARFGRIDVLVNNAGYGHFGPLEAISGADLARVFDVNVLGLAAVTRHVLPVMRRQQSGTVVNVSSKAHGIRVKLVEPLVGAVQIVRKALPQRCVVDRVHSARAREVERMRGRGAHRDTRPHHAYC